MNRVESKPIPLQLRTLLGLVAFFNWTTTVSRPLLWGHAISWPGVT